MNNGIFVHQEMYIEKVLKRFYLNKFHSLSTPIVVSSLDVQKDLSDLKKRMKNYLLLKHHILVRLEHSCILLIVHVMLYYFMSIYYQDIVFYLHKYVAWPSPSQKYLYGWGGEIKIPCNLQKDIVLFWRFKWSVMNIRPISKCSFICVINKVNIVTKTTNEYNNTSHSLLL